MNFGWVYPEDSGEYLCRATNKYGMDETRAVIKTKVSGVAAGRGRRGMEKGQCGAAER